MNTIIDQVKHAVGKWREIATQIGISRSEQEYMVGAFAHRNDINYPHFFP